MYPPTASPPSPPRLFRPRILVARQVRRETLRPARGTMAALATSPADVFFSYSPLGRGPAAQDRDPPRCAETAGGHPELPGFGARRGGGAARGDRGERLREAWVVLLLVSADFLSTDAWFSLGDAGRDRSPRGGEWPGHPRDPAALRLGEDAARCAAAAAEPRAPVTSYPNQSEAFTEIAKGIRSAVRETEPPTQRPAARRPSSPPDAEPHIKKAAAPPGLHRRDQLLSELRVHHDRGPAALTAVDQRPRRGRCRRSSSPSTRTGTRASTTSSGGSAPRSRPWRPRTSRASPRPSTCQSRTRPTTGSRSRRPVVAVAQRQVAPHLRQRERSAGRRPVPAAPAHRAHPHHLAQPELPRASPTPLTVPALGRADSVKFLLDRTGQERRRAPRRSSPRRSGISPSRWCRGGGDHQGDGIVDRDLPRGLRRSPARAPAPRHADGLPDADRHDLGPRVPGGAALLAVAVDL